MGGSRRADPRLQSGPVVSQGAILLTGLPSSGKTTLGAALVSGLEAAGTPAHLFDGDELRDRLPPALGFSRADRIMQAHRATYLAEVVMAHGIVPVLALVLPFAASRTEMKLTLGPACVEVHLCPPIPVCVARDTRGTYRAASARGDVEFAGILGPYEVPAEPDVALDTSGCTVDACVEVILAEFARRVQPAVGPQPRV